jgi:2-polyprenyl-6-methoxyphenol hydroxylase-like FAD-dependent oxidoreductase
MIKPSRKALIIGGGIAGPATATFLRHAGFEADVFEAWPKATDLGGGLQIAPNGMHVLAELGLAEDVRRAGSIASAMAFYAESGSYIGAINRNMEARFGQPAVNIRRSLLQEMLLSQTQWQSAGVHFGKRLIAIDDVPGQPLVAHCDDGSSAEGDFLIGADGVHSAVRTCVLPHGPRPFDTGLIGFGGFVPRAVLETFNPGQDVRLTFGRSGFFGYGFCGPDPANGAMWWSTQPAGGPDVSTFRAMGPREMKRHLLSFHAGWHRPIPELLEAAEEIIVTATLDVATLPTWRRGRVLLIGDAAHATSPHAGQGASLALEDASRLAKLIQAHDDVDVAFASFEDERRERAERIVALARQNGNNKREFGVVGAFIRNQMMKVMLPVFAGRQDWMYDYDARAA